MLDLLSSLHALYWRDPYLDTLGWLNGGGVLLDSSVPDMLYNQANFDRMLSLPRGAVIVPELRHREKQQKLLIHLLEYGRDNANCLIHGDPHLGNSFWMPDGTPGFLDWQTAMYGYWTHDVGYFLAAGLTIADRRHAFYALGFAYCPPELQVEEVCATNAERVSAALIDLRSMEAWDEPMPG